MKILLLLSFAFVAQSARAINDVSCSIVGNSLDTRMTWATSSVPVRCNRHSGVVNRASRAYAMTVRINPGNQILRVPLECRGDPGCRLDTISEAQQGTTLLNKLHRRDD